MVSNHKKYGIKDTIVAIEVNINVPIKDTELEDIKHDIFLFIASVGGTLHVSPLDAQKSIKKILAVFEINHRQIEEVERYYYEDQEFAQCFDASLTINSIEPVAVSYVKDIKNKSYM